MMACSRTWSSEAALAGKLVSKKQWAAARLKVRQSQAQLDAADAVLADAMQVLSRVRNAAINRARLTSLRPAPTAATAGAGH